MNLQKIGLGLALSIGLVGNIGYAEIKSDVGDPTFYNFALAGVLRFDTRYFQNQQDLSGWCITKAASPSIVCESQKASLGMNKGITCSLKVEIAPVYQSVNSEYALGNERVRTESIVAYGQDLENGKIKKVINNLQNINFIDTINNPSVMIEKLTIVKDAFENGTQDGKRLMTALIGLVSSKSCDATVISDTFTKTKKKTILNAVGECLHEYEQFRTAREHRAKYTLSLIKSEEYQTYQVNQETKTVDLSKRISVESGPTKHESKLIDESYGKQTREQALEECESNRAEYLPLIGKEVDL